jgi:hypothetical protein
MLSFVFDRDVVDARFTGVSSLAVIRAGVGECGELDRDVLDNVTEVSSFFESLDEAAGTSETTLMLVQAGQTGEQAIVEASELTSLLAIQLAEIEAH